MQIVIPSAGLGSRFLPLTCAVPKELLLLGEESSRTCFRRKRGTRERVSDHAEIPGPQCSYVACPQGIQRIGGRYAAPIVRHPLREERWADYDTGGTSWQRR